MPAAANVQEPQEEFPASHWQEGEGESSLATAEIPQQLIFVYFLA